MYISSGSGELIVGGGAGGGGGDDVEVCCVCVCGGWLVIRRWACRQIKISPVLDSICPNNPSSLWTTGLC